MFKLRCKYHGTQYYVTVKEWQSVTLHKHEAGRASIRNCVNYEN